MLPSQKYLSPTRTLSLYTYFVDLIDLKKQKRIPNGRTYNTSNNNNDETMAMPASKHQESNSSNSDHRRSIPINSARTRTCYCVY